ncbi:MAG: 16S rRNA (adenine1518-N6/adenine1519-N6)-dimethyltransferase [Bacteroidia bacterium]|jgi:16S rRNA (adenine1518-N6/adenine1519-N6)-dimethyltransferase
MAKHVRAKKFLGQHFLKDESIAKRTADLVDNFEVPNWLEIGPGMGVLTKYLIEKPIQLQAIELDRDSVAYLAKEMPSLTVYSDDFLKVDLPTVFKESFGVIGNFPYNISSQILFKILENKEQVPAFAGMFQLEVAKRIAAGPNNKTYGILSVLVQAFYNVKLEFEIPPTVFKPPPKVMSGVISGERIEQDIDWNVPMFFDVVKTAFQQRRKTLSNALKKFNIPKDLLLSNQMFKLRAENLTVEAFKALTAWIEEHKQDNGSVRVK